MIDKKTEMTCQKHLFRKQYVAPKKSEIIFYIYYVIPIMFLSVNIKKKMWYDCQWDNAPQETKNERKQICNT